VPSTVMASEPSVISVSVVISPVVTEADDASP
jgi:hypothetical protein